VKTLPQNRSVHAANAMHYSDQMSQTHISSKNISYLLEIG